MFFCGRSEEVQVHDDTVTGKFLHNFDQYYQSSISQVITNNLQGNSDFKTKICPIEITWSYTRYTNNNRPAGSGRCNWRDHLSVRRLPDVWERQQHISGWIIQGFCFPRWKKFPPCTLKTNEPHTYWRLSSGLWNARKITNVGILWKYVNCCSLFNWSVRPLCYCSSYPAVLRHILYPK